MGAFRAFHEAILQKSFNCTGDISHLMVFMSIIDCLCSVQVSARLMQAGQTCVVLQLTAALIRP